MDKFDTLFAKLLKDPDAIERFKGGSECDICNAIGCGGCPCNYKQLCSLIRERIGRVFDPDEWTFCGTPVIWGASGIGKTEIVRQIFKKAQEIFDPRFSLVEINLATKVKKNEKPIFYNKLRYQNIVFSNYYRDIADKTGVDLHEMVERMNQASDIKANGGIAEFNTETGELEVQDEGCGGILFFDEITYATTDEMNTIMSVAKHRTINNISYLGSKWTIICAANRYSDMEDIGTEKFFSWDPYYNDVVCHYDYHPEFNEWKEWWLEKGLNEQVLNFLESNMKLWIQRHKDVPKYVLDPNDSRTTLVGNPRNWTNFAYALNDYLTKANDYNEFEQTVQTKFNGDEGAAIEALRTKAADGDKAARLLHLLKDCSSTDKGNYGKTTNLLTIPDEVMKEMLLSTVGPTAAAFFMDYRNGLSKLS